jgi:hypothetical protein
VLPSEYVPVAVSTSLVPNGIELFAGVITIDSSARGVTEKIVLLLIPLLAVAVMVVEPAATAVASPEEFIVATAVLEDFQVTLFVRFAVVPSEYFPVAVN